MGATGRVIQLRPPPLPQGPSFWERLRLLLIRIHDYLTMGPSA